MTIRLYMDHHVPGAITAALRDRGFDVLTAHEDGASELPDDLLLQRASVLGRTLFSRDRDLLREAALLQRAGTRFAGVIYAHQLCLTIGECVEDLALIVVSGDAEDVANRVTFLPL